MIINKAKILVSRNRVNNSKIKEVIPHYFTAWPNAPLARCSLTQIVPLPNTVNHKTKNKLDTINTPKINSRKVHPREIRAIKLKPSAHENHPCPVKSVQSINQFYEVAHENVGKHDRIRSHGRYDPVKHPNSRPERSYH